VSPPSLPLRALGPEPPLPEFPALQERWPPRIPPRLPVPGPEPRISLRYRDARRCRCQGRCRCSRRRFRCSHFRCRCYRRVAGARTGAPRVAAVAGDAALPWPLPGPLPLCPPPVPPPSFSVAVATAGLPVHGPEPRRCRRRCRCPVWEKPVLPSPLPGFPALLARGLGRGASSCPRPSPASYRRFCRGSRASEAFVALYPSGDLSAWYSSAPRSGPGHPNFKSQKYRRSCMAAP
jgi:hypothetical protein